MSAEDTVTGEHDTACPADSCWAKSLGGLGTAGEKRAGEGGISFSGGSSAENTSGLTGEPRWCCRCCQPPGQPRALDEAHAAGSTANAIFIADVSLMGKDLTCIYSMTLKILQQLRGKEDRADRWGRVGRTCTSLRAEMQDLERLLPSNCHVPSATKPCCQVSCHVRETMGRG